MSSARPAVGQAMDRSVTAIRSWTPSTWLLATGLLLWVVAQYLPAAVVPLPGEDPEPSVLIGLWFTLFGWLLGGISAVLGLAGSLGGGAGAGAAGVAAVAGVAGIVGWFANVWLAAMLHLRWRSIRPRRALTASIAGLVCAIAGVVALYLAVSSVQSVGIGTWVWLASFAVVLASMVLWRPVDRGEAARAEAEAAAADELRQVSVALDILSLEPTGYAGGLLVLAAAGVLVLPALAWEIGGPIGLVVLAVIGAAVIVRAKSWLGGDDGDTTPPATRPGTGLGHH